MSSTQKSYLQCPVPSGDIGTLINTNTSIALLENDIPDKCDTYCFHPRTQILAATNKPTSDLLKISSGEHIGGSLVNKKLGL